VVGDALARPQVVALALRLQRVQEAEGTAGEWRTALPAAQSEEEQRRGANWGGALPLVTDPALQYQVARCGA